MKRRAVLYVTDCEEKRFDMYLFRQQLPFTPAPLPSHVDEASERGKRRADYSLMDAFLLRLMMDIIDHGGLDVEAATYVAGNIRHRLIMASERLASDQDVWIGYLQNRPNAEMDFVFRQLFAGSLEEVPEAIRERSEPNDPPRVVLINASAASRFVIDRADEFGVTVEREPRPVWMIEQTY